MSRLNNGFKGMDNKKMNDKTYSQRRKVMYFVYEAKNLIGDKFKRVDIRITEGNNGRTLACARLNDFIIWVPEETLNRTYLQIRQTVFHEIVHAITGFDHDENCPLMRSTHKTISKKEQDKHFIKYFK